MTIEMPDFMKTRYYKESPNPHVTSDAPDEIKTAFEDYMNDEFGKLDLQEEHKNMKNPFYKWDGKVIDKG